MEKQEQSVLRKRTQKDYSLAFKMEVVAEIERGESTYPKSQQKYGIQGCSTVLVWLRKYGRLDWNPRDRMQKKDTPQQRIRELEQKLKRVKAEKEILHQAIDIADKELGTDIRKKYLALLSEATRLQGEDDTPLP